MGQGASSDRSSLGRFVFGSIPLGSRPPATGGARVDTASELRATSDLLLLDLQALGELEELKRTVPHGDPKLVDIASRIEELARKVLYGSQHQRDLTETITAAADPASAQQISTIEDVRSASAVLAEWRE